MSALTRKAYKFPKDFLCDASPFCGGRAFNGHCERRHSKKSWVHEESRSVFELCAQRLVPRIAAASSASEVVLEFLILADKLRLDKQIKSSVLLSTFHFRRLRVDDDGILPSLHMMPFPWIIIRVAIHELQVSNWRC
jgi:hypothetical protein